MPRVKKHNYLLVLVDTFLGWVEAFPTSNKRASTVASLTVTHIIPRFGMPTSFQSDNGPEFTSQITQTIIKALNISWNFHIPCHPPSSRKVECTNRTLKEVLTKLTLGLHLDWVQLLPIALFHLRVLPQKPTQISPFEVKFGCPALPPGITSFWGPLPDTSPFHFSLSFEPSYGDTMTPYLRTLHTPISLSL
jgi:transposase InsO family protein